MTKKQIAKPTARPKLSKEQKEFYIAEQIQINAEYQEYHRHIAESKKFECLVCAKVGNR